MAGKPNADDMLEGLDLGSSGDMEGEEGDGDSVAAASDILDAIAAKDAKALDTAMKHWLALADNDAGSPSTES